MSQNITIHDKSFVPFIDAEGINQRVVALAKQINEDYAGKNPLILVILNGSFMFAADLFRKLTIETTISFVRLSSYAGTSSTGAVNTLLGIKEPLTGRHVIIVEDIIDTGKTLASFLPVIAQQEPESVEIATFLVKPTALKYPVHARYVAFEIEDRFVVGYGLDYDELGRNLPNLYVLA